MIFTQVHFVNTVIVLETLVAAHIMAYYLPKRENFALRAIASSIICIVAGLLFYVPLFDGVVPIILYSIFMYGALAIIPGIAVLFCRKMSIWEFLFCVSGGHSLHQLAGQLRSFIAKVTMIDALDYSLYNAVDFIIWASTLLAVYLVFFLVFVLKKEVNRDIHLQKHRITLMILAVIVINLVLSSCILFLAAGVGREISIILNGYNLVSTVLEIVLLFSYLTEKRMENELQTINVLLNNSAKQYELSKQNIDMINIKCHDMKKRIDKLYRTNDFILETGLKELKENISIYDSTVKTGNDVLDVILTEKSLVCEKNGITFSVIADGRLLDFILPYDLYCLFDNAVTNAIEAVMKIDNPQKRDISLTVKGNGKIVSAHIENFYVGELKKDGDEILTSKYDEANHGFGIKSMRAITEKYKGILSFTSEDGVFMADILFPR